MASQDSESSLPALSTETSNHQIVQPVGSKKGGRITVPFVLGSSFASTIAVNGVTNDLMQFLVRQFNIKNIQASQITNIINSLMNLTPVAGAILCDSYLGCFLTISIFTFISFVGTMMITISASVPSLKPPSCNHLQGSCELPSSSQFAFLCLALVITTLGSAGTSYTYVTIGANQFHKQKDQEVFVSWYFFSTILAILVSYTAVVFILDNVGWNWGFGICTVLNAISVIVFLVGKWYYQYTKPEGCPFVTMARVVICASRKIKVRLSVNEEHYYGGIGPKDNPPLLTSSFSFMNRAALITEGDTHLDGSVAKPWRLCTIQEVEDLKTLLKLFPLLSTGILLNTVIGIQGNLTILQSLTMDRGLGLHFKIPAASFQVFVYISTAIFVPIINRFFYPFYGFLIRRPPTIFHRIGVGHVINIVGLAAMACVETRRLQMMHKHELIDNPDVIVPFSALWLVPPLLIIGAGSAFYVPGQMSLYYQEFPALLKNTGTAMMSLAMGIGFYLSTSVVNLMQKTTPWLADDLNKGRVDNVYWMLAALGGLNSLYYLLCAKLYKLQSIA